MNPAPETQPADRPWWQKAMSQPDWLWGVLVGGMGATLLLLVIFPQQEYAREVREPNAALLTQRGRPLPPEVGTVYARARERLAQGQVDAGLQDLESVLAKRPDHQESRWLAASTYDRLGDATRAASHYRLYLEIDERDRPLLESRAQRAKRRLNDFHEMP